VLNIVENLSVVGAPLGSSQRSHRLPSWWGWACCPSPRTQSPTKLLLHNKKLYVTYVTVLCLVTLTDL